MKKSIRHYFVRLCNLLRAPEHETYLNNFHHLSEKQIEYVIEVINEEIEKSAKFGLKLLPDDILKEKIALISIFDDIGQGLNKHGPAYSDGEYAETIKIINGNMKKIMQKEIAYYFDTTPPGETRNRYNCHLESVASRLAKDFMDKKCEPLMGKIPAKE